MSVASDSLVPSSSNDDLAACLETVLESDSDSLFESFPSEEADEDAEVANHRLKRQRLAHQETIEEEEIELLGANVHKKLKLHQDEISRLRESSVSLLQRQRKLCLVLDLDHTLLNSTVRKDLKPEEEYMKSHTHSPQDVVCGGNSSCWNKAACSFIFKRSQQDPCNVYIHNGRKAVRKNIWPSCWIQTKEYFGDQIISRDDGTL